MTGFWSLTSGLSGVAGLGNNRGYTARKWDSEIGLYYYRNRFYDASIGRFISEDPWRFYADVNLYRYVWNMPTLWIDPFGLAPGDSHKTGDDAGKQAVQDINATSIKNSAEYAGRIYKNPDGTYSYTAPNKGGVDWSSPGNIPAGKTDAGYYHTHGSDSKGKYNDENFSGADKDYADKRGTPGYLGTPKGGNTVQKYKPKPGTKRKGNITKVKKDGC